MGSPKQTTVVLNETIQKIKDELAPIYGLQNILSAGLFIFSRLSDTVQKKVVSQVSKFDRISKSSPNPLTIQEFLRDIIDIEKENPDILKKILSPETIAEFEKLTKELRSELIKKKVKKRG